MRGGPNKDPHAECRENKLCLRGTKERGIGRGRRGVLASHGRSAEKVWRERFAAEEHMLQTRTSPPKVRR
ncbi:unnamed protein product [Notodromas monacha]|uniref:Uncharacterized protein n=1 Tax=Notodromas monacha TaxID=399045 RepID=A0A7R9G9C0_9CRUS|nr:unnamed protein product [Notodromas monacha]CAG0913042.1 unnamed protein product [Notodromas monacha]